MALANVRLTINTQSKLYNDELEEDMMEMWKDENRFWLPEPIIGWRMWTVWTFSRAIRGTYDEWQTREMDAVHQQTYLDRQKDEPKPYVPPHDAPGPDCRCGINAYKRFCF